MADTKSPQNKELTCALCSKLYDDPCVLPCLHSFCRKCLAVRAEGVGPKHDGTTDIRCPIDFCQYVTTKTVISQLPGNRWLRNQVQIYHQVEEVLSESPQCEFCEEHHATKLFCVQCSKIICEECKVYHRRARDFKKHSLIDIANQHKNKIKQSIASIVQTVPSCPEHGDEILKFYCTDCKRVICRDCIPTGHNGHNCTMIDSVKSSGLDRFKKSQVEVDKQSTAVAKAIEEGNNMKKLVADKGQDAKRAVNSTIDNLVAALEKRRAELLKACDDIVSAKKARLDLQLENLRNLRDCLSHCSEMVSSTINSDSAYDFQLLESMLSARIDNLTDRIKSQKLKPSTTHGIISDINPAQIKRNIMKFGQVRKGCYPPLCVLDVPIGKAVEVPSSGSKTLRLTMMDEDGKRMTYGGQSISIACSSPSVSCSYKDNGDGTYDITCRIDPTSACTSGRETVEITINDLPISGTPFEVLMSGMELCMPDKLPGRLPPPPPTSISRASSRVQPPPPPPPR